MNEFLTLAKTRYSTRKYQERPVEQEKLMAILEAGRVAPTACNYQPQRVLVIREQEGLQKLAQAATFFHAPLAILVCVNHDETWKRDYDNKDIADVDATIVTDHMILQATALGLQSVWICNFDPVKLKELFHIPDNIEPVNLLAIGYEAGEGKSVDRHDTLRKLLEETVVYESF
jgi:nitroreductase